MNMLHFGEAIRQKRKELNMTQQDLESKSGVTQSTISKLESGGKVGAFAIDRVLEIIGLRISLTFPRNESEII